ncbi:MAG: transcriptional repressor [Candidatus Moranbacteria bacterium]|nr:transcriptional repressor [Candidatus Moranbacteria bacterium]
MHGSKDFLSELQGRGFRLTKARKAVVAFLNRIDAPQSIPEISEALRKMGLVFNKTTVYRELAFLVREGIAKEVRVSDEKRYYELVGEHHHHTICVRCGDIQDVLFQENLLHVEREISERDGFRVLEHSLEFFGLCSKCKS